MKVYGKIKDKNWNTTLGVTKVYILWNIEKEALLSTETKWARSLTFNATPWLICDWWQDVIRSDLNGHVIDFQIKEATTDLVKNVMNKMILCMSWMDCLHSG